MFNEPKPVTKTLTEKYITLTLKVEKSFVRVSFSDIKFIIPFGINYRNDNSVRQVVEIISTSTKKQHI